MSSADPQPIPARHPTRLRWHRFVLVLVAITAVAFALYEGLHWFRHVYEPNARIEAEFTVLSSSVDGAIEHILVRRGDRVEPHQQLASMDTALARLEVASLEADLAKEQATRRQVEAELEFFLGDLANKVATARESIANVDRELGTVQERWEIARANVARNNELLSRNMVSRQIIDDANDKLLAITSMRQDLQTRSRVENKRLQEIEGLRGQESIYLARLEIIDRNIDKISVLLAQSRQRLEDMHIYSPIRGVVNEIHVNPGAFLELGDPIFLMHDPEQIWVEAEIDESDIRHVKVGQRVVIDIDAYPFEHFSGSVRSIGQVTSAVIAEGRNSRGAGAQKIPVIIDFEPIGKSVWPGMRVAVNIVIR
jgi:membrane fusion protein (multidrug efflux system)